MKPLLLFLSMFSCAFCNAQSVSFKSLGINLGGLAEMYDVHTNISIFNDHHQVELGLSWKPVSNKFAYYGDFTYVVFPVQYQYHFMVKKVVHLDLNAGLQFQYYVSATLPDYLKITPAIGLSYTKKMMKDKYYVRGGLLAFIPAFTLIDKYELFGYTGSSWLVWPQVGLGKYLH
ncbi:MAG: hypothetical protein V4658_10310 [Bacteroidota bacterium]